MSRTEGPDDLERVRSELRRLGYLDHSVERFLLQDAFRPERPLATLLQLSAKVGLLAGAPIALVSTLILAAWNGLLAEDALDLLPLFLHLLPPMVLAVGVVFLTLAGVLTLVLSVSHARRIDALSFATAAVAAVGTIAFATWQSRELLAASTPWRLAGLALALPLLAYALVKVIHGGLLTLAIRLTERTPERRSAPRWWLGLALSATALLLLVPAALEVGGGPGAAPASLPADPAARVLLVGVDGVLPEELGYLLARGELPALASLLGRGAALLPYRRSEEPPAAFWVTLATGVGSATHGIESLDSFRPRGVSRALGRSGWLRGYWARVGVPLGLVEYRPVLSHNRRAFALWELAARGGAPVVVVNWWGTFPAASLPGEVVAHDAYQLLAEGSRGAVSPAERRPELAALARSLAARIPPRLAALRPPGSGDVLAKAVLPDAFYLRVFRRALAARPRAAALYLPGLDLAADLGPVGSVAMGDLVRHQLRGVDRLLDEAAAGIDAVAVVFDPGRRGGGEGRAVLYAAGGCSAGPGAALHPEAVAAGLLRALGLPQSRQLPPPPPACVWPVAGLVVDSYGERRRQEDEVPAEEYLESLRSLGYL